MGQSYLVIDYICCSRKSFSLAFSIIIHCDQNGI